MTTILSKERVRGTWNSGVVPLRRKTGIAGEWKSAMERLLGNDFSPPEAGYLKENNVLSALAAAHYSRFQEVSFSYNYPVQNWDRMTAGGVAPEDAVLWHYQPFFDKAFHRFADRIDGAGTLRARLAITQSLVDDLRHNYRRRIGIDETWLQSVRRRVRAGTPPPDHGWPAQAYGCPVRLRKGPELPLLPRSTCFPLRFATKERVGRGSHRLRRGTSGPAKRVRFQVSHGCRLRKTPDIRVPLHRRPAAIVGIPLRIGGNGLPGRLKGREA